MQLFQSSPLEFPIWLLRQIPMIGKYYPLGNRYADAYEHFWTGFILTLLFSIISPVITPKASITCIVVTAILHVLVKELRDWKLHGYFNWVDFIVRSAGFILCAPISWYIIHKV